MLYILDYGAGNVRSLANSIEKLGFEFKWVQSPDDIQKASKLLFPGVGAFGPAMKSLHEKNYAKPLVDYIKSGKSYMGICIGMQALFLSSTEAPEQPGLGIIPARIERFQSNSKTVPHIGWNGAISIDSNAEEGKDGLSSSASYYFVHSFRASFQQSDLSNWPLTVTRYGDEIFVSSVRRGNVFATQFHPEKSGQAGLEVLKAWLNHSDTVSLPLSRTTVLDSKVEEALKRNTLKKRIIACLDVRTNDAGDLVVTKGDQYDVREAESTKTSSGQVRNLGKPVDLARRYYAQGADEITFLNITSFRSCPLHDQPMLDVVKRSAETVFVPLCIGGGIRDTVDPDGTRRSALEVATQYFRAGADKVSIGGDAVLAVEAWLASGGILTGGTGIETISRAYGSQAVVVSIDPRRVYVACRADAPPLHEACVVDLAGPLASSGTRVRDDVGPNGERCCWYQCTVKGGRESRPVDVVQLARGVEALGAGEILLNSVDRDGSKAGFDLRLVDLVKAAVRIPVIASSGAGCSEDFEDVFTHTPAEAALAAGIFHRQEVPLERVKAHLASKNVPTRIL